MANIGGILGAIAQLPGVINQGLLGPLPADPGVEGIIGAGQMGAARQRASNDFAMALLQARNNGGLPAATQYAQQNFSGRIFDLLKQQEAARLVAAQQQEMQRQAAFRANPTLANASMETQERALLEQMKGAGAGGFELGKFNPGDFTTESFAEFIKTQDPRVLRRWVSPANDKVVVVGGVPSMVDPRSHEITPLSTLPAELSAKEATRYATTSGQEMASIDAAQVAKLPAQGSMGVVIEQFREQIPKTAQGGPLGVKGRAGAVTDSQDAFRFDNLREQLSTELRTIFRIPGEGALSDTEQRLYGLQLPDRRYDPETNERILRDIEGRVEERLTKRRPGGGRSRQQPAAPAPASDNVVDWSDL